MKICLFTHTFPRSNLDTVAPFMDGLARGLVQVGNEVFVLTPYNSDFQNELRPYKIIQYKYIFWEKLHKIGYSQTLTNDMGIKPVMYLLAPLMILAGFIALLKLINQEKIEIINAHWILPNGFIGALASILTGVPLVSTLPGSDVYVAKKNFIFSWMARFADKVSAAITSNSPQLIDDLGQIGANSTKGHIILYGVDPAKFKPDQSQNLELRKKYGISEDKIVILSVGRLVAKKGFLYLIEATDIIKKNNNFIVVIVGEGSQRKELENKIKAKHLENFFILPGWIDYQNLVNYYNLGDIFILPSIRDQGGNLDDQSVALVEAMACGRPVVTSNFPGYKLVVKEGKNGFLVSEKNSTSIAQALKKLIDSKKLRNKMGRKSLNMVIKHFTWKAISRQYTVLFKSLK